MCIRIQQINVKSKVVSLWILYLRINGLNGCLFVKVFASPTYDNRDYILFPKGALCNK